MANTLIGSIKHAFTHKVETLDELFVEQLQDLYSAETQLIEALPMMAAAAKSSELKAGFKSHLAQTKEHAVRLEKILQSLEKETGGKKCQAMAGLIKEGNEMISKHALPSVKDAGAHYFCCCFLADTATRGALIFSFLAAAVSFLLVSPSSFKVFPKSAAAFVKPSSVAKVRTVPYPAIS